MSEEQLTPQGRGLDLRRVSRIGGARSEALGHEQRRLAAAIVEQPTARWVQAIGARDAQDVRVRGYLVVDGVIQEGEARVIVVGQDGTAELSTPGLRAMVHVGKVTAHLLEPAD